MRIRLAWSALAVVAAVTAAWFRTSRRCRPSSDPDRRHTGRDEGCGLVNDQIDPAGDDPSSGSDEPQGDLESLTQEGLPFWKVAARIWGVNGLLAWVLVSLPGAWLAGRYDDHLLSFTNLLVGPCAVLISVSIVSITFTGDWKMSSSQSKRREDLFVHSFITILLAVVGIASAGAYATVAPMHRRPALLSADIVQIFGASAASFLSLSLFGVIRQVYRMVKLIRNQRPNPEDVTLAGEHQNSHNDARA